MKYLIALVFCLYCAAVMANVSFQVSYTGFDALQMAAFEHAVSLWEPLLDSDVPIKINARFQQIPGFVMVFVPNMVRNFTSAPQSNIWYCTAMANMIAGTELNPGEADMDMFIVGTADHPWYYGLDDNCPAGSYDFVTEVFKAVAYGLGYMPSFYVQQGYGSYGMLDPSVLGLTTSFPWEAMQGQPALYDTHIVNTQGQHLTDSAIFTNPSTTLNAQLTGGNLRYEGQWAEAWGGGTEPVLYAGAFNLARTARLSGTTYNSTENESGVPTGIVGGGARYPSPIVLGILKDLGWTVHTQTLCEPLVDFYGYDAMGAVTLDWSLPETPYDIHTVTLYLEGTEIVQLPASVLGYSEPALEGIYNFSATATYSMGVSEPVFTEVFVGPVDTDDPVAPELCLSRINVAPNPFRTSSLVSLELGRAANTRVELYNLKGQKILELQHAYLSEGVHSFTLDAANLSSGLYLIRAQTGDQVINRRVLLLR